MAKRTELVPVPAFEVAPWVLSISSVDSFQHLFRFPPDCSFLYPPSPIQPGQKVIPVDNPLW